MKKEDVQVKEKLQHSSQKEAAHGYGGKYGVMKGRQDKVTNNYNEQQCMEGRVFVCLSFLDLRCSA